MNDLDATWSCFTIMLRSHRNRQDRNHFCRIEATILSIVAVLDANTKYPDAFVLRRQDSPALADVPEDRTITFMQRYRS